MNRDHHRDLTAIVVPCFNEEHRLEPRQFLGFLENHQAFRLQFVDDGSSDDTHEILQSIRRARERQVDVLRLATNRGKAEAVRAGARQALHNPQWIKRLEFVAFFDADMATPLSEIVRMVDIGERRNDIDLIVGSRMALAGHRVDRSPLRRRIGQVFATSASWLFSLGLRDTQCGAKLFRNVPKFSTALESPFSDRWLFDVELLARFRSQLGNEFADRILEMPLESWQEVPGSKLKPLDFARAPLRLLKLFTQYRLAGNWQSAADGWEGDQPVTYHIDEHRKPTVETTSTESNTQPARKAA